jgi:hypothetical protein
MNSIEQRLNTCVKKLETVVYFDGLIIKDLLKEQSKALYTVSLAMGEKRWWLKGCLQDGRAAKMTETRWGNLCKELVG